VRDRPAKQQAPIATDFPVPQHGGGDVAAPINMAAPSTEERELDLVEKVDFRILNVANNEKKFQEVLGRYLAPLLLKASSPHASVRHKVGLMAASNVSQAVADEERYSPSRKGSRL